MLRVVDNWMDTCTLRTPCASSPSICYRFLPAHNPLTLDKMSVKHCLLFLQLHLWNIFVWGRINDVGSNSMRDHQELSVWWHFQTNDLCKKFIQSGILATTIFPIILSLVDCSLISFYNTWVFLWVLPNASEFACKHLFYPCSNKSIWACPIIVLLILESIQVW
jgi:hypothetical protein